MRRTLPGISHFSSGRDAAWRLAVTRFAFATPYRLGMHGATRMVDGPIWSRSGYTRSERARVSPFVALLTWGLGGTVTSRSQRFVVLALALATIAGGCTSANRSSGAGTEQE